MKKIIVLMLFAACTTNSKSTTQDEELKALQMQFNELVDISNSMVCDEVSDWTFAPYGSKACGGPQGFIAYSNKIDVASFLTMLEAYSKAEKAYNIKWEVFSDCSIPIAPSSIGCEDGKAVLIY